MDEDDEFIIVGISEEQQQLIECWKLLPIFMPFDEFCQKVTATPSPQGQTYYITQAITGAVWCIQTGWSVSGYMSAVWTLVQYRSYIQTGLKLLIRLASQS